MFQGFCEPGSKWTPTTATARSSAPATTPRPSSTRRPRRTACRRRSSRPVTATATARHTASTAAGNFGVPATVEGRDFGTICGMAPAAKIAAYKVCFSDNDPDSGDCYTSSSLAPSTTPSLDGVDVINYSISGATRHRRRRGGVRLPGCRSGRCLRRHLGRQQRPDGVHGGPQQPVADHGGGLDALQLREHRRARQRRRSTRAPRSPRPPSASVAAGQLLGCRPCRRRRRPLSLCGPSTPRPRQGDRQDGGLRPRRLRPRGQERRGQAGRWRRDGARQPDARAEPRRRLPLGADRARGEGTGDAAITPTRHGRCDGGDRARRHHGWSAHTAAADRWFLLARSGDRQRLRRHQARHLGAGRERPGGGRPADQQRPDFDLYSGTSMASPHIAGLAAFMLGVHPSGAR